MSSKFNLIVADPPWEFSDHLTMSETKRGAKSQYQSILSNQEITNLPIEQISAEDAILFLWVPSALLDVGLAVMKSWGFEFKQTFIWVKTKQEPAKVLFSEVKNNLQNLDLSFKSLRKFFLELNLDLNLFLSFYLGRIFRQTHEIALVGVRGKVYPHLQNKSQRSVFLGPNPRHSEKPEEVQDRLEILWPEAQKIELFARRDRNGWLCLGNECPSTKDEDIRDSLQRVIAGLI